MEADKERQLLIAELDKILQNVQEAERLTKERHPETSD